MNSQEAGRPTLELDRIIRRPELLRVTGLSAATIFRLVREGEFPSPVALSKNSKGWFASQVRAWQESLRPTVATSASEIVAEPSAPRPKKRPPRDSGTSGGGHL
jgi:prophage regulatory protein